MLEESVIQDCTVETKAIKASEDISSEYPSYTAISMKYPEDGVVLDDAVAVVDNTKIIEEVTSVRNQCF